MATHIRASIADGAMGRGTYDRAEGWGMLSDQNYDAIVEAFYAAALEPARWNDVIAALTRGFGVIGSSLITPFAAGLGLEPLWATDADPEFIAAYASRYAQTDVLREPILKRIPAPWATYCWEDLVDRATMEAWEGYRDLLAPRGVGQGIGLLAAGEDHRAGQVMIYCPRWSDDRVELAKRTLGQLGQHFARALKVHWYLAAARQHTAAARITLDMFQTGVAWLAENGEVLYRNQEMDRILRAGDGIALGDGVLRFAEPAAGPRLQRAIGEAQESRESAFLVERNSGPPALQVRVVPLPIHAMALRLPKAAAIAFVSDIDASADGSAESAAQLHGLSPAETRLLKELTAGRTIQEAAERLGIADGTARSQLKATMEKCGVHRQADLIRLVVTLPRVG
jgi:DNA-binding CsgD family transcriptional regulator